jgi:hypothetical protein
VTTGAGMTTADPAFVGGDDLHLSAGSPLRDMGLAGSGDGPTDIDGQPRTMGAAPDIGADELEAVPVPGDPAPAPAPPPAPAPGSGPGTTPAADTVRPTVTFLRRTSRGFSFRVSETARVRVTIAARKGGKRRAGRCVAPTRALRRARKCTRLVTIGSLTRSAKPGTNSVAMVRKVGRRTLKPGRYTATVVATDAAGNRSIARRVTFTVKSRSRKR